MSLVQISEDEVKRLLDWPSVCEAIEQSFRATNQVRPKNSPYSSQPPRSYTNSQNGTGMLLTMPGFIGNYKLPLAVPNEPTKVFNSLGCKLVTVFPKNVEANPPKSKILANILLLDENSGELKAIVQATEITAWRTAAASIVATKHLYFNRQTVMDTAHIPKTLAIVGCGVQGRSHAIGMCMTFSFGAIHVWNRTKSTAEALARELEGLRSQFKNPSVTVLCFDAIEHSVRNADVIVTSTFTSTPLITRAMIKRGAHVNAVGAAQNHYSELAEDLYNDRQTKIYVDSSNALEHDLKGLKAPIAAEVGEVVNGTKPVPTAETTIFQSTGMGIEDVAVAQAILEKFQKLHPKQ